MANNNFWIELVATLEKAKSKVQIKTDIKGLGNFMIPLIGSLSKSKTRSQIKTDLASMNNVGTVNLNTKVNSKGVVKAVQEATTQAQKKVDNQPIQMNFSINKDRLINDIKLMGQQNSKLFNNNDMASKYNTLLDSAKFASTSKELSTLRVQLSAFRSELKITGNSGYTMGDQLHKGLKKAIEIFSSFGIIMAFTQQLKNAWTEALNLDKSFTDLIKVQDDLSRSDYPEYLEKCNEKAQELATTQKELMDSATEFSKSGYSQSTSDALTEKSTILSNVGDMTASDSAKAIISGVQAYDLVDGYDNVIDKAGALIDKYNEIGNTASISTEEIAKGVQSVGSVFADANVSVDQFIALLASGNRQFQDADSLALGLRTSALRIRGCTAELEAMGEETEDVVTSTSKLAEKIEGLTNINGNGGVKILEDDEETFRSIYDIYVDIGKVYQQMSDVDQSALLDLIAGKHRASGISATLNNMSEAQEIYQNSLNATGSAQEEYDKYLVSSDASLNRFKASMTETYQSVIDGKTVTGLLNCGNASLQFANSLGLVESSLKGLIAIGVVKAITLLSTALKASAIQASNFSTALDTAKSLGNIKKGTQEYINAVATLKSVSGGLSELQLKQVLASNALTQSQRIQILQTTGLSKAQAQAKLAQMELTQTTNTQTVANGVATASTFSLSAAIKGFGLSLKTAFLSNPVTASIMILTTAFGAVSSKVSEYNQKIEDARQNNIEAGKSAAEEAQNLSDVYIQYEKLASVQGRTTSQEEEFKTAVENITTALGTKAEALSGIVAGTNEYTEALKNATKAELENKYTTAVQGRKSAEEELGKDTYSNFNGSKITIQLNEQMTGVENHIKALNTIREQLLEFEDTGMVGSQIVQEWKPINFDKDKDNMENIIEYYNALTEARKTLILEAQNTGDDSLLNSNVYKDIDTTINSLKDSVEDYQNARYNELKLEYMWQNGVPSTIEDYYKMEDAILSNSEAGETFQETLKGLLSSDFSNLTNQINVLDYAKQETSELVQSYESLSTASESNTKSADSLRSSIKDLNDAFEEQNEFGQISVETMLKMIESGYATALSFDAETGACTINAEAMQQVVKSKIQNQIQDLQMLKTDIASKLKEDGLIASESAKGFIALAKSKATAATAEQLASIEDFNEAEGQIKALQNVLANIDKVSSGTYTTSFSSAKKSASKASDDIKDIIDDQLGYFKSQLDAGLISYKDFVDKSEAILNKYSNRGKLSAKDYWSSLKSLRDDQIDANNKVINAVVNSLDKKIKAQENERSIIEENYKAQISALESEKEKIEETNKARQQSIDLQKAQYDLVKSQQQRDHSVLTANNGVIYDVNAQNIRDKKDVVVDKESEIEISKIDSKIASLNQAMDESTSKIDQNIASINEIKNKWNDIADNLERGIEDLLASQILGANWESDICDSRLDTLTTFTNQYVDLMNKQKEAAIEAAKAQSEVDKSTPTSTSNNNNEKKYDILSSGYATSGEAAQNISRYGGNDILKTGKTYSIIKKYSKGGLLGDKIAKSVGEDHLATIAYQEGERILSPIQNEMWEKWTNALPDLVQYIKPLKDINIPDYSNMVTNNNNNNSTQDIHVTFNCPNLTDSSGINYIKRELGNLSNYAIQRKNRLK